MWVFGYGSLIWKVDFPYERKIIGYIKGYVRRFYQKSTDHRGIPTKPGRVVTLLSSNNPDDEVWGVAYKIASEDINSVVNHLDFREKGGYERKTVLFYPCNAIKQNKDTDLLVDCDEKPFNLTIYIGAEDNPNFAGAESLDIIANHIVEAKGPSGPNTEYLYNLALAMKKIAPGVKDDHLFSLEKTVKKLHDERMGSVD